ncbi:transglutaminase-like domain-containing protein [Rapidithrix thailandica]|uniref:Transglutaminase-like domain-containing protein n=1 Tax=Rapidithrix thailandica TaxID=413964 RepID=A0AAW9RVX1_9BACT
MVATGKREIRSGREYNRLFPSFSELEGTDKILQHGDVFDTLNLIEKIVKETLGDTKKLARHLKGKDLETTTKNIFDFIYRHIQYRKDDPGTEQLHRPLRIWKERARGVDCDDYTIFISSILSNLKVPHYYRMTRYKGRDYYQHVYVVVPKAGHRLSQGHYVIDPVVDRWNYEVPYSAKFDRAMQLPIQYLNGVDEEPLPYEAVGLGATGLGATGLGVPETFGNEFDLLGVPGLGAVDGDGLYRGFLDSLKKHLQNTRIAVSQNLAADYAGYRGVDLARQIDSVLQVWEDPVARSQRLDELEAWEEAQEKLSGLGGFFKKLWKGVKKGVKAVGKVVKKGVKAVGKGVKWVGDRVGDGVRAVGNAIARYNPLSLAARGGLEAAFRSNLFKMSERLGYGYLSEAQARQIGLDLDSWRKSVDRLKKTRNLWVNTLKGKEGNLRHYIIRGWEKGVKKHGLPFLEPAHIDQTIGGHKGSAAPKGNPTEQQTPQSPAKDPEAVKRRMQELLKKRNPFYRFASKSSPLRPKGILPGGRTPSGWTPGAGLPGSRTSTPSSSVHSRLQAMLRQKRRFGFRGVEGLGAAGLGVADLGATGLGAAGTAVGGTAASGFIAKIVSWLKGLVIKVAKGAGKLVKGGVKVVKDLVKGNKKKLAEKAAELAKKKLPLDKIGIPLPGKGPVPDGSGTPVPYVPPQYPSSPTPQTAGGGSMGLVLAAVAVGGLLLMNKSQKPAGLSGAPARRKGTSTVRKKTTQRKATSRKTSTKRNTPASRRGLGKVTI